MEKTNELICGNNVDVLKTYPDNYINLTVTSPPYDDLRDYKGYSFDFEGVVKELFRVTKKGGVVVWVVGDAVMEGGESGTSFKQALYFKEIGFNLHDTMIFHKSPHFPEKNRYPQTFDYMFVFSKGKPKTFNPIIDHKNKPDSHKGGEIVRCGTLKDGEHTKKIRPKPREYSKRWNIWWFPIGYLSQTSDKIAYEHPAIFPEKLAQDHIISWSNEGDLILDPFAGSGTTLKMAKQLKRNYIGIEINNEYFEICCARVGDKPTTSILKTEEKHSSKTSEKTNELSCKVCGFKSEDKKMFDEHLDRRFHLEQVA